MTGEQFMISDVEAAGILLFPLVTHSGVIQTRDKTGEPSFHAITSI